MSQAPTGAGLSHESARSVHPSGPAAVPRRRLRWPACLRSPRQPAPPPERV